MLMIRRIGVSGVLEGNLFISCHVSDEGLACMFDSIIEVRNVPFCLIAFDDLTDLL
jgi:hypothetical protein